MTDTTRTSIATVCCTCLFLFCACKDPAGSTTATAPAPAVGPAPAPAPAQPTPAPAPAAALTPETCEVASFTEARKITSSIYDPPRGEFDFTYNEGHFALLVASESAWGSMLDLSIMDKDGNQQAGYMTVGKRMEYDPNIVAAPWGGFFVSYKFDKSSSGTDIRISGRTMGYDGKWAAPGFLATSNATSYGIRLRRLDDKIGFWYEEYPQGGTKETSKYLEVMDGQKYEKPLPSTPIPPLFDEAWLDKLEGTPGWPLSQNKAIRVVWADDRFGVIVRKRTGNGEEVEFMFFTALCK
jgi:hypothetical protein